MTSLIAFTNNYLDCSTDNGFQFEFYCDGCGSGHMSPFVTHKAGVATTVFRAAGGLLGGVLGGAASNAAGASEEMQNLMRGKARDEALRAAVTEAKKVFKQCGRCGSWVCPEACWNPKKNQCDTCAPDLDDEIAAAQASAQKEQIWRAARTTSLIDEIDVRNEGGVMGTACPSCGTTGTGKFCGSCGAAMATKSNCTGCGAKLAPGAKFCAECGQKS
jgi:uncharacterized OB-fold protein